MRSRTSCSSEAGSVLLSLCCSNMILSTSRCLILHFTKSIRALRVHSRLLSGPRSSLKSSEKPQIFNLIQLSTFSKVYVECTNSTWDSEPSPIWYHKKSSLILMDCSWQITDKPCTDSWPIILPTLLWHKWQPLCFRFLLNANSVTGNAIISLKRICLLFMLKRMTNLEILTYRSW